MYTTFGLPASKADTASNLKWSSEEMLVKVKRFKLNSFFVDTRDGFLKLTL